MRCKTADEAAGFYTTEQIGRTQELTPEGFLLCRDVPICRTGVLLYGAQEVPVEAGKDGIIRVERSPEEVFKPEHIASYLGKPVCNDHPDEEVNPSNWSDLTIGTVQNPRQGEGAYADCVLADLLITTEEGIKAVQSGKREVSCGYDADYDQIEPGRGRQLNLIGNHVALVERGRCGSRCAIGDKETVVMATKLKSLKDRLMAAFKSKDEEAIKAIADEMEQAGEQNGTHVHVHLNGAGGAGSDEAAPEVPGVENKDEGEQAPADPLAALGERLGKIEAVLAKLIPQEQAEGHNLDEANEEKKEDETKDEEGAEEKGATTDRKTVFQDTLSRAEILVPGFKMPLTMDAAPKDAKAFKDAMCKCKRRALDEAVKKHGDKVAVFLGGQTVDKMSCATVDAAFIGASELIKAGNNRASSISTKDFGRQTPVQSINAKNRSFWNPGK